MFESSFYSTIIPVDAQLIDLRESNRVNWRKRASSDLRFAEYPVIYVLLIEGDSKRIGTYASLMNIQLDCSKTHFSNAKISFAKLLSRSLRDKNTLFSMCQRPQFACRLSFIISLCPLGFIATRE